MSAAEIEPPPVADLATARANADRARLYADVLDRLALSDRKAPLASVANAIAVLDGDPVTAGSIRYDDFGARVALTRAPPAAAEGLPPTPGPYPRTLADDDEIALQSYVQRTWGMRTIARDTVRDAITAVARAHHYHPVVEWLDGLTWDGRARLDGWAIEALGAPDTDYASAVGAKTLIAAVRRVRHPGCQWDHLPVLEGEQGAGKSSALRALFGDAWFSDALPDSLGSRDAAQSLQGLWCIELAEIEQLIRGEVETIKAFLSRRVDHYAPRYGRNFVDRPRQCVLIGTTNSTDYLRDSSGNRRFWPLSCGAVDLSWIQGNRDQLWAEAAAREASGEAHWLADAGISRDAAREQSERVQDEVWASRIREIVAGQTRVHVPAIINALGIPIDRQNKGTQMRVADVLRLDGWHKRTRWPGGKKTSGWELG